MTDRTSWLLALASANLVVMLAGAWLVDRRLQAVERAAAAPAPGGTGVAGAGAGGEGRPRPGRGGEAKTPPTELEKAVAKLGEDSYDQYSEIKNDLYELRTGMTRVQHALKRLNAAVAKPGQPGGTWNLAPLGDALPAETIAAYRRDAEAMGVRISDGRVEVRGFLNVQPDRSYPMEFFVTRWPESGHETLIHVVGSWDQDPEAGSDALKGLVTAVYKGLVVAGFQQGEPSGYLPNPDPKKRGTWIPPKGDVVHVGVRYRLRGKTHVARASDWVLDPEGETASVLPEDAWRFTGGLRMEDGRTGDEMLSAEGSGKVASVFQDWNTLVEIAVASNRENDYQYNAARIPRPDGIVVMGEAKDGVRLFVRVDRTKGAMSVVGAERNGEPFALSEPPVLLVEPSPDAAPDAGSEAPAKPPEEVRFSKPAAGAAPDEVFVAKHAELENRRGFGGRVRLRAVVDGKTLVSTGSEPLFLDLIFSRTPVVPEGDGAVPVERVTLREPAAKGTGVRGEDLPPDAAPPPAMDDK